MGDTVHATTVALGEHGVLIRGDPGAGKTSLALAAIAVWSSRGHFSGLVADDRTALCRAHERVIATAPPTIATLADVAGTGVIALPSPVPAVRLSLVVDLVAAVARVPAQTTLILDTTLPAIELPERQAAHGAAALWVVCDAATLDARA